MAWVRIHDGATDHPKLAQFIDWRVPFCVWIWCLSYAQRHLTNGYIPRAAVPNKDGLKSIDKLCAAALIEITEDGFQIHDYLDWNDSKAVIVEKRLSARDRAKQSRTRASERAPHVSRTSSSGVSVTESSNSPTPDDPEGMQGEPSTSDRRDVPDRRATPRRSAEFGRIFLHRWQLDALIATLGPHADAFDLDAWLDDLNRSIAGSALPADPWKFVKTSLDSEVKRRGLSVVEPVPDAPTNKRIAGLIAGGEAFLRRQSALRERGQA